MTALALVQTALAFVAVLDPAVELGARNDAGIPLWVPLAVSLVLGGAAACTWSRYLAFGRLRAFWAVSAACFAAKAPIEADWPWFRPVLMAFALAAWCGAALTHTTGQLRRLLGLAVLSAVVVLGALALPSHPGLDAGAYGILMLSATRTAIVSQRARHGKVDQSR